MSSPLTDIKTPNDVAIYWRRFIGVETIPAISKEKRPDGSYENIVNRNTFTY
jgi:hypothetical protein